LYAKKFRGQSITGVILQQLDHEMLEFSLAITNPRHREQLLSAIRDLFPKPQFGSSEQRLSFSSCQHVPSLRARHTRPQKGIICPMHMQASKFDSGVYGSHTPLNTIEDQAHCDSCNYFVPSSRSRGKSKFDCKNTTDLFLQVAFKGYSDKWSMTAGRTDNAESEHTDLTDKTSLSNWSTKITLAYTEDKNIQSNCYMGRGCLQIAKISNQNSGKLATPWLHQDKTSGRRRKSRHANHKKLVITFQPGETANIERVRSLFQNDTVVEIHPMT